MNLMPVTLPTALAREDQRSERRGRGSSRSAGWCKFALVSWFRNSWASGA
jgi:hypothetical protein